MGSSAEPAIRGDRGGGGRTREGGVEYIVFSICTTRDIPNITMETNNKNKKTGGHKDDKISIYKLEPTRGRRIYVLCFYFTF